MTVSAKLRPTASASVHPKVSSAWGFHAVMRPDSSSDTNASCAVSTIRRKCCSDSRSACSARLRSVMSVAIAHTAYDWPVVVTQRELRGQVGVRAVRVLDRLLDLERHVLPHHPQVVGPHRRRQLAREQLLVAAARGSLAVDPEHLLEAAVHERVAAFAVLDGDHGRRVVDDRLHALAALVQGGLCALARGHVLHLDDQVQGALLRVAHERHGHQRHQLLPVGALQALLDLVSGNLPGQHPRHVARVRVGSLSGDDDLRQLAPHQLLRRPADQLAQRTVHPQEAPGTVMLDADQRHADRRMLEGAAKALLGLLHDRIRAPAIADVAQDRGREVVLALAPARERGFQRNLLAVGPAAGRRDDGALAVLELRRRLVQQLLQRAPTTSPAGRPKICWAAMFTYATLPCSSTDTIASAAEAATARKCFSLRRSSSSACLRPIRVPTWAATADTSATRRSSSSRCSNTKNSITATTSSSAMTGTATPPASPTACANRPRSNPGSERTSRIQTAPSALPRLARQADPRDERQRLGHAAKRGQAGRGGVPGRAAHQCAAVGAQHPCLADRPAGSLADAPQHHLEGTLGGVCPGDRQRQVVRERKLLLRPAAFGDVAADAVDQLEAGVRPRAELEPAIGAVERSQPRLEGGHAPRRDHPLERVRRGRRVIGVQQLLIGVPREPLRVEAEHQPRAPGWPTAPARRTRSRRAGRRRSRAATPGRARREAPPSRPRRLAAAARSAASSSSETTPKL